MTKEVASQYYRIELESYSSPRWLSATSLYYGTLKELKAFGKQLSMNVSTAIRYQEIIEAINSIETDSCMNCDFMLTPVTHLAQNEFTLENHRWTHRIQYGAGLECAADRIEYKQMLLESPQGLDRVVKARFVGLRFCLPGIGWIFPEGNIRGFPGIITWNGTEHVMNLYACEWVYLSEDSKYAYQDLGKDKMVDLDACVRELVGEL